MVIAKKDKIIDNPINSHENNKLNNRVDDNLKMKSNGDYIKSSNNLNKKYKNVNNFNIKISLKDIKFTYKNGIHALDDITFNVEAGDFIGIIGPNGTGKSTLLRILDGILKPQVGTILIQGIELNKYKLNDLAKVIGYIPQNSVSIFPTTVFDTVLLGRKPYIEWGSPTKKDIKITSEILYKLGLEEIAMRNITELSGGQLQKVLIARTLAQQPDIILLDEPTSNLDINHQLEVLNLLRQETKKNITVIIAIHDLNLAIKFCNKFIILNNGKIEAIGGKEVISKSIIEKVFKVRVKIINDGTDLFIIPMISNENEEDVITLDIISYDEKINGNTKEKIEKEDIFTVQ
ncbi:MAG: ABC transporter ATP-binding protein [Candidatus Helarchaeota archaeon]